MKNLSLALILLAVVFSCRSASVHNDEAAIKQVLNNQSRAWSNNAIETYMEGYWKSDSLKFYGKSGLTLGWENTLNVYKKAYPNKDYTGTLEFKINSITKISADAYYVMGEFFLTRKMGDTNGIFLVIFKRINGAWKIIADSSC